jgi:hypothetical protein
VTTSSYHPTFVDQPILTKTTGLTAGAQVDLKGKYAILAGFFPHFLRPNLKILQKPPEPNHFSPSQSPVAAPALLVLLTRIP